MDADKHQVNPLAVQVPMENVRPQNKQDWAQNILGVGEGNTQNGNGKKKANQQQISTVDRTLELLEELSGECPSGFRWDDNELFPFVCRILLWSDWTSITELNLQEIDINAVDMSYFQSVIERQRLKRFIIEGLDSS